MPKDDTSKPPQSMAQDMRDIRDAMIRMDESSKGVWHVLNEDVKPVLKDLPETITSAITRHQSDCPARTVFMAKVTQPSNAPPRAPSNNGFSFPRVPRNLIYFCVGLGILVTTVIIGLKYLGIL